MTLHCEVKIHFLGKRDCSSNISAEGLPKIKGLLDNKCMDPYRKNDQVQRPPKRSFKDVKRRNKSKYSNIQYRDSYLWILWISCH